MIYLNRLFNRDKTSVHNYTQYLQHKKMFGEFDEMGRIELMKYLDELENMIRTNIIHRIVLSKHKLDLKRQEDLQNEEKNQRLHQILLQEAKHNQLNGIVKKYGNEDSIKLKSTKPLKTLDHIAQLNADLKLNTQAPPKKGLFDIVAAHPKTFKALSIGQTRRKMAKTAGIERGKLDIDRASEGQKNSLKKAMSDKYATTDQRTIIDICLNHKNRILSKATPDQNFRKTKEMLSKFLDGLDEKIEKADLKKGYILRRHKSSSSVAIVGPKYSLVK